MEQLTITNIVLALCGLLLHIGAVYKSAQRKEGFLPAIFFEKNWVSLIMSIVAAVASILMSEEIIELLGFPVGKEAMFFKVHAFISGYMGSSVLSRVFKIFK